MVGSLRFLFFTVLALSVLPGMTHAASKDSMAYTLAALHTRNENPESVLLHKTIEPASSVISEFEWILQSLQNRCTDPEPGLANAVIETWYITKKKGADISLLEIARALSQLTQNTNLFGREKIPIQLVAKYWLAKHFLPALKK